MPLKLSNGRFLLRRSDLPEARQHFMRWYGEHTWPWLPARIAEYVVAHELVHLHESHHTPEFWLRLERAMPDFEQRKVWLAENGMSVEGV